MFGISSSQLEDPTAAPLDQPLLSIIFHLFQWQIVEALVSTSSSPAHPLTAILCCVAATIYVTLISLSGYHSSSPTVRAADIAVAAAAASAVVGIDAVAAAGAAAAVDAAAVAEFRVKRERSRRDQVSILVMESLVR